MKQLGTAVLILSAFLLAGCGDNSTSSTLNGNWRATLSDASGNMAFGFTTTLSGSGTEVTGTNPTFTTSTPCFGAGSTITGSLSLNSNFNGVAPGVLRLTIQSGTTGSGSNTLALTGNLNNNTVTGTWTLGGTGAGCTGFGTFTMVKF